ncbi:MAG: dipeptidyl-peptidase 4 [Acidobacteriota bacterium]|jgi:dipeptidyl-peptidase-4|nr:dipeptidyl-peptidase 4 [Acidobacteriota bacterium]
MKLRTLALLLLLAAPALFAGTRKLTIDDIYDPKTRVQFSGTPLTGVAWVDDTHFFVPRTKGMEVVAEALVDAATGKEVALFDVDDLQAQAGKIEGVSEADAKKIARPRSIVTNPKSNALLLTIAGDLYTYAIAEKTLTRLTHAEGDEEEASFSPDGAYVSFVRKHNIFIVDANGKQEKQLTTTGGEWLLNGILDWVYQEEVFGRGNFRAYWWSPDSKSIAYLSIDESPVKPFTVVDHIPYESTLEVTAYPLAGGANPIARIFVVDATSGATTEVSRAGYEKAEPLVVDVAWTRDSKNVICQIQDREQTWLDLVAASRSTGAATKLLHETTEAWVERQDTPRFLKDGSMLWFSERTGFKHLYRVSADGKTQKALTSGEWEVRDLHGVDEKNGWIYFSGTKDSPIELHVYRMKLDGSSIQRISSGAGTHVATFNEPMTMWLDAASDVNTPPHVDLRDGSGKSLRAVNENRVAALAEFELSKPEFVQVKTRDGFTMEGMLIRPTNFDPAKKYPIYEHTYSGPHAPQVRNAWGSTTYMFHQMLAQNGIAVWICDNRSASGKGAKPAWTSYKNFGPQELRDLEDGVAWLKTQPWADTSRIVLNGWSFGGFMTSYAMTHPSPFHAGIAGGSVTDWHNYDSIYTERYMLTPEHNKEGYATTAPRTAAKNLHGNLLLLHGTNDDNVHIQNTIQFIYELEKAGKQFEFMVYPKSRHGVTEPLLNKHLHQLMFDFVMRNVK